jgi:hypothetical protein
MNCSSLHLKQGFVQVEEARYVFLKLKPIKKPLTKLYIKSQYDSGKWNLFLPNGLAINVMPVSEEEKRNQP